MRRCVLVATLSLILFGTCLAQEPTIKPSFDVVSIRPGSGQPITLPNGARVLGAMQGGPGSPDPERLTGNSVLLQSLLTTAFGVKRYQISGPGWIETSRFDITAKIPPGTPREQFNLMLQSMFEERFKLKLHHETKEFPAYNMVVAKGGLKLRESVSTDACSAGARPAGKSCPEGVTYQSGIAKSTSTTPGRLSMSPQAAGRLVSGIGMPLSSMLNMLEGVLGGPILFDKTGLTGTYDFRFEFASPTLSSQAGPSQDDTPLPTLFTALDKDLGLKLESAKAAIDVLVIDHIEQPSEN